MRQRARCSTRRCSTARSYDANPAAYDETVFINTPLTVDARGNVFFGFMVTGAEPGRAGRAASRASTPRRRHWVAAATAAGDAAMTKVATNSAPALSPDWQTVYVAVSAAAAASGRSAICWRSTRRRSP